MALGLRRLAHRGARYPNPQQARHDEHPAGAWHSPWCAGWLHVPVALGGLIAWLNVAVGRVPGWPEVALFMALVALVVLAVVSLRSQAMGPAFCGPRPAARKVVALTFDDGPDPRTTPQILEALGDRRATFFVVGEKARAHPDLIAAMQARGHAIVSHGERHSWTAMMTVQGARDLVMAGVQSLRELGIEPSPFFRPPYGLMTPPLLSAVREAGLTLVGWSRRSWDTVRSGPADQFAVQLAERIRNGDIVLLHDTADGNRGRKPLGMAATRPLVAALTARGFDLVTVDELARGVAPE